MLDRLIGMGRRDAASAPLATLLRDCTRLLGQHTDAGVPALAGRLVADIAGLDDAARIRFVCALNDEFGPDAQSLAEQAQRFARTRSAPDLMALAGLMHSPRQQIVRALARAEGGMAVTVALRAALLRVLPANPHLRAFDAEMLSLLNDWFSAGLLTLARVDWSSPAATLEKLIEHEAMHAVDGWSDLRRRLQPDRRCYAFFHPAMPADPLIFVEIALLEQMPDAVAPLLDRRVVGGAGSPRWQVAACYGLSHCHPGLHGVHLGTFLIRQVVQALRQEHPGLQTFCTLSPLPGFATWLTRTRRVDDAALKPAVVESLNADLAALRAEFGHDLLALVQRDARPDGARTRAHAACADRQPEAVAAPAAVEPAPVRRRREDRPDSGAAGSAASRAPANTAAGGWLQMPARAPARTDAAGLATEYHRLRRLCAFYLLMARDADGTHPDPVARFHLRNGASVGRINMRSDSSPGAMASAYGTMVNFVYDMARIEQNHLAYLDGEVNCAREVMQQLKRS